MADKKIQKALYGPSTMEVALGAVLGLSTGLLVACVYLVFKPVLQVKEMPKEPVRGAVYFLPGSDVTTKGKGYAAKQKAFIAGNNVDLIEDELNSWSGSIFGSAPPPAKGAKPPPKKAEESKADPAKPTYDGLFNPDRPNFKISGGKLQIGFKCVLNWYGLAHEVLVVTTGTLEQSGNDFVYVPTTLYLGSCPVHLIPGAARPLADHLLGKKKVPDEIKSAWAKLNGATLDGNTLKLTVQ